MIMAAGTGGHVFPGLAVAAEMRARGWTVVWLGTQRGIENRARAAGRHRRRVDLVRGRARQGRLALLAAPFRIARALAQALGALRRRRPAAVLGMGGFVACPGGFAAWLHAPAAAAARAERDRGHDATGCSRRSRRAIFAAFPGSFPGRRDDEVIGNPVRATIVPSDSPRRALLARRDERLRLLVVGGSLGAES